MHQFWDSIHIGVVGKGKGEVGGSKVKEESGTIQVIEFNVVMKSVRSCVVMSSYCYSWPVSPTRLKYTYIAVMTVTAISGLHH